jgi:endonuclease-3
MDDPEPSGGTYTLLLALSDPVEIEIGALGTHALAAGAYAYTGSALGSGGFTRVDRHRRVAAGENDTRHWHVDYLTGPPETELVTVVTSPGVDAECAVADRLPDGPVAGFGASDCDCRSHLASGADVGALRTVVESAHRDVRREV